MSKKRFIVSGRVQGVWYRASTQQRALELGIRGWVRNLPEGSVELLAGGEQAAVEKLNDWLWQGPSHARVEQVQAEDFGGDLPEGFEIQ